jgi:hypothetical protein
MRELKDREPFKAVGEATRVANRCLLSARRSAAVLRTFIAIEELLTSRSRVWDFTSHKQLADIGGISRRAVIDSVKELVACGAIAWEPGSPGSLSRVRLAPGYVMVNKSPHQAKASKERDQYLRCLFCGGAIGESNDGERECAVCGARSTPDGEQTSSLPMVNESGLHGEQNERDIVKRKLHTSEKDPSKSADDDAIEAIRQAFNAEIVGEAR